MAWFKLKLTSRLSDFLTQIDDLKSNRPYPPSDDHSIRHKTIASWLAFFNHQQVKPAKIKRILLGQGGLGTDKLVSQLIHNYNRLFDFINLQVVSKRSKNDLGNVDLTVPAMTPVHTSAAFEYHADMIKKMYQIITDGLSQTPNYGEYRKEKLVIHDVANGSIVFQPPSGVRIPFLINQLIDRLNKPADPRLHSVIKAAGAHYYITAISPFVSYNDEVGRAFGRLVLQAEAAWLDESIELDDFFYQHQPEYSAAFVAGLQSHPEIPWQDITSWCQFYAQAVLASLKRLKTKTPDRPVHPIAPTQPPPQPNNQSNLFFDTNSFDPREIVLLDYLRSHSVLKMAQARRLLPDVSDDTILRVLKRLKSKGLIVKIGQTKGTYYKLRY